MSSSLQATLLTDTEVCEVESSNLDNSENKASTTGQCLEPTPLEISPETKPLEASPPLDCSPPHNVSVSSDDSDEDESDSEGTVSGAELEDLKTLNQSLRPFRDKLTSGSDKGIIIIDYRGCNIDIILYFIFILFFLLVDDVSVISVATSTSYLHGDNVGTVRELVRRSVVKRRKYQARASRPNREKGSGNRTRRGKAASTVSMDSVFF